MTNLDEPAERNRASELEVPTFYVTSNLFVGAVPTHLSGLFTDTNDPTYALRVMSQGATAVVPSFDVAAQVLRLAGRSEDNIAVDIAAAKGEVEWDGTF